MAAQSSQQDLKKKMAPNGRRLLKRSIHEVSGSATKSSVQQNRNYGDGVRRCRKEDIIIYLDLPRWDPGEPPGAVMVTWAERVIVLLFGRTVG